VAEGLKHAEKFVLADRGLRGELDFGGEREQKKGRKRTAYSRQGKNWSWGLRRRGLVEGNSFWAGGEL